MERANIKGDSIMNKNKEELYNKALKQMNKQFKKSGIKFSWVEPTKRETA